MSKYDKLWEYVFKDGRDQFTLSFEERQKRWLSAVRNSEVKGHDLICGKGKK